MSHKSPKHRPFDKIATSVAGLLFVLITLLIISGDRVVPQVKDFNLEGEEVSVLESQLIFEFNRDMNKSLIEESISIDPSLEFQSSWVGKKLFLSLEESLAYGVDYSVQITGEDTTGKTMETLSTNFSTHEKELYMIDTSSELRQITSYFPDSGENKIHTPEELYVTDYEFVRDQDAIVFFAVHQEDIESSDSSNSSSLFPELYLLDLITGETQQLTNDPLFLNFDFFVAPDGKTIGLNRVELESEDGAPIGLVELWLGELEAETKFTKNHELFEKNLEPFWYNQLKPEKIQFTEDSKWILAINDEGYILLPTELDGGAPIFLGTFFESFGFSHDGSKLLFTRWKEDNIFAQTNELVLMHIDGSTDILLQDEGEIDTPIFDAQAEEIYFSFSPIGSFASSLASYSLSTGELRILDEEMMDRRFNLGITADSIQMSYEKTLFSSGISTVELQDLESNEIIYSADARAPQWRN